MKTISLIITGENIGGIGADYALFGETLSRHTRLLLSRACGSVCSKRTLTGNGDPCCDVLPEFDARNESCDAVAVLSPFAFRLPENVLHDSVVSVLSEPGEIAKHGVTLLNAVDAVVIGAQDHPTAAFLRAELYKNICGDSAPETVHTITAALASYCAAKPKAVSVRRLSFAELPNTRSAFFAAADDYRRNIIDAFIDAGIDIPCPDGVTISPAAKLGKGTVVRAGVTIGAGFECGENCVLGPGGVFECCILGREVSAVNYCVLTRTFVGDGSVLNAVQATDTKIGADVRVGPYCHLRPNTELHNGVRIGDFVEVKNSVVGEGTHASHLTYIGDSDVGARVNFGCGVVTVNYDGAKKHRTVIGDDAFIGCNTNLVAPVRVGSRAYTAAGSTVTDDVPDGALAIARERQVNKDGWADAKRERDKKQSE